MQWSDVETTLERRLAEGLPGADAQLRLAPRPRYGWRPDVFPEGCRQGAGLLLIYPIAGQAHLALTVRDRGLIHHAGQVSFPGGAVEAGETIEQTALREAHEEVNVSPSDVRLLGRMSPLHIPVSKFVLHPVVGVTPQRPDFRAEPGEVARILEPGLAALTAPSALREETTMRFGAATDVPYLEVDGEKVWGATAMVLAELFDLAGLAQSLP